MEMTFEYSQTCAKWLPCIEQLLPSIKLTVEKVLENSPP